MLIVVDFRQGFPPTLSHSHSLHAQLSSHTGSQHCLAPAPATYTSCRKNMLMLAATPNNTQTPSHIFMLAVVQLRQGFPSTLSLHACTVQFQHGLPPLLAPGTSPAHKLP